MVNYRRTIRNLCLLLAFLMTPVCFAACSPAGDGTTEEKTPAETDTSGYLVAVEEEPDTVDFQCTTIHYTIAINVFDRLVETEKNEKGDAVIVPSLAKSWEVSEDELQYTFHLQEGVKFSNGSPLTASDVLYSFTRLLTWPDACNQDIIEDIEGAKELARGETGRLKGFEIISDSDFVITLEKPFSAFLNGLSMPGASIMDEETTREKEEEFGTNVGSTIGTGPFILTEWEPGEGMLLAANPDCWSGGPGTAGLDLRFMTEVEEIREMYENGELDILDLDDVGNAAQFYIHGDIYKDKLQKVERVGMNYIALNETVKPLNDVRVRKALQMSLNRKALLDSVYSGLGTVEHGLYPHNLYGYNPELAEIPYDPAGAKELLAEAGYPDGFDLTFSVDATSSTWETNMVKLAASMWEDIGVHTTIDILNDAEFMKKRKSGKIACFTAMWTADYNDPDNFAYTFFGNPEKTKYRSICYANKAVMKRVSDARMIIDPKERIREYQDLEKKIVQEDSAWIPLFSRLRYYVTSDRVEGFQASWNGSVKNEYRNMTIRDTGQTIR